MRRPTARSLTLDLLSSLKAAGLRCFDFGLASVRLRKPSRRLVIDTARVREWPADVLARAKADGIVREEIQVDKTALRSLDGYLKLPGVEEVEGEETIEIR